MALDLLQPETVYELQLHTCLWHRWVHICSLFIVYVSYVSCMIVFLYAALVA